ncbi:MAG TPA: mechanosensitive ion channel family protein, partial [Aequorivita sp.]|nr:mechanosensitive ion channel family protein [Aequorivita sp.]
MTAFFETYKEDILYAAIIIASVFVLRFLTNLLHKWLLKQELKKYPGESPKAVNWVKR